MVEQTAPPSTVVERLDERFESVTVALEDREWVVVRIVDPNPDELEIYAALWFGELTRDERTGCYGMSSGPGDDPRPVMWPVGAALSPAGALTVPGFGELAVGETFEGGGGEVPLPAAVAELCDAQVGYEIGVVREAE